MTSSPNNISSCMTHCSNTNVSERKLVVLTPVKNESWFLPIFCKSTSIWADYIIIADQKSTDNSREIASKFPKVVIIDNDADDLDEGYRDTLLINKARELVGTNGILFKIDADEIFTPNFDSDDWNRIKQSKSGSVWIFRWIQINNNLSSCWEVDSMTNYGAFVDDGRNYSPHGLIHVRSMFMPDNPEEILMPREIGLLHFQFVDWKRMCCKHIWYQCFERINFPNKSAIDIYRMYHWMYNPSLPFQAIPTEWIDGYKANYEIDLNSYVKEKHYWWDDKVKEYLTEYSPKKFRHIETYHNIRELLFAEGKNIFDKLLLLYLHYTKSIYNMRKGLLFKFIEKADSFLIQKMKV